jgi:hypothetical protein
VPIDAGSEQPGSQLCDQGKAPTRIQAALPTLSTVVLGAEQTSFGAHALAALAGGACVVCDITLHVDLCHTC